MGRGLHIARIALLVIAVAPALAVGACSSGSPAPASYTYAGGSSGSSHQGDAGLLAPCDSGFECASDSCVLTSTTGYCSKDCSTDADCPANMACTGQCELLCTSKSTCMNDCACKSGDRCAVGTGCIPLSDVGGPCTQDSDCKSAHCGANARTCDVPVGAPCTASNCEICETWTNGTSYCSRTCASAQDCNGYGGICAGSIQSGYQCQAQCQAGSSSCGTMCELVTGEGGGEICPCDNNCTETFQPGVIGAPCYAPNECQSGDCVSFGAGPGICSLACGVDSQCGPGGACIACGTGCGMQCFLTCDTNTPCSAGQCNPGTRATGAKVSFCDPHVPDGTGCNANTDCSSGRCGGGGKCIPSGGLPSGTPCTSAPSDCSSSNCCNGNCC